MNVMYFLCEVMANVLGAVLLLWLSQLLFTKRELPPVEMLAASDDGQMTSRKGCVGDTKSFWHAREVATSSKLKREMDPKQHFVTFHHINTTASLLVEMEQMRKEMVAMRSELATLRIESILGKRKSDDR